MPLVRVPTPLRPYTDGQKDVKVGADTVGGALAAIIERYPSMRTHLLDESGALRSFVHVFLGDQDVRDLHGEATHLEEEDRVLIVPSIAGGSSTVDSFDPTAPRLHEAMIIPRIGSACAAGAPGSRPWSTDRSRRGNRTSDRLPTTETETLEG